MTTQLPPSSLPSLLPLYAPLDFNLVLRSMVTGSTPAWAFADREDLPHLALLWDRQDALLLAGDNQDLVAMAWLRNLLHNQILPEARARWIPELALFYTPAWEPMLPSLLNGLDARPAYRYSYRYPESARPKLPPLPDGYALRRIDAALLESERGNLEQVQGWIDSFWHSPADFLRAGYGFVVETIGAAPVIASWCLTVFAAADARELGLATIPEHRSRGLASQAAAACILHGQSLGQEIHWHCWTDNPASAVIAEKLGFQLEREYKVYRLKTGLDA